MTPEEGLRLEPVVNGFSDVDSFDAAWPNMKLQLEGALGRSLIGEEEDKLYSDLRDWWKNNPFGEWSWGEWPWWVEERKGITREAVQR